MLLTSYPRGLNNLNIHVEVKRPTGTFLEYNDACFFRGFKTQGIMF